jgi:hypothetical protein
MVVVVVVAVWAESALALSGQIKSVDDAARRLVVTETGTNRDFNFVVSPQATIVTATNRAFDFGRLKAGDGVAVTFDRDLAVRIVANQATLVGFIKSVDLATHTLVVLQQGTDRPIAVALDPQAPITSRAGDPLAGEDLKPGGGVAVVLNGPGAAKVVLSPPPLRGFEKSINLDKQTLTLNQLDGEREITVPLADQASILSVEGKSLALKDLKPGDGLAVTMVGDIASRIDVSVKPPSMAGQIKSIAGNLRSFVIEDLNSSKDVTVGVTDNTAIVTKEGKTLRMSDLKDGDGVGVTVGKGGVADQIVVNPKP